MKEFDKFWVEADVSGNVERTVDIQIRVKMREDMRLEPQVQFTLLDKKWERTLEKSIWYGEIFFEGLAPGLYYILIVQKERPIGEIALFTAPQE